jgi:hypothetical protein
VWVCVAANGWPSFPMATFEPGFALWEQLRKTLNSGVASGAGASLA